jgi:hypothetical protein
MGQTEGFNGEKPPKNAVSQIGMRMKENGMVVFLEKREIPTKF